MLKSFANGNGPNGTGLGGKPAAVAAAETTAWDLMQGKPPGLFAS